MATRLTVWVSVPSPPPARSHFTKVWAAFYTLCGMLGNIKPVGSFSTPPCTASPPSAASWWREKVEKWKKEKTPLWEFFWEVFLPQLWSGVPCCVHTVSHNHNTPLLTLHTDVMVTSHNVLLPLSPSKPFRRSPPWVGQAQYPWSHLYSTLPVFCSDHSSQEKAQDPTLCLPLLPSPTDILFPKIANRWTVPVNTVQTVSPDSSCSGCSLGLTNSPVPDLKIWQPEPGCLSWLISFLGICWKAPVTSKDMQGFL